MKIILALLSFLTVAAATLLYDGRAPLNLTEADLDASLGPYLTWVTRDIVSEAS